MFPHSSRLNHQNTHLSRQSDPFQPFYHNLALQSIPNNWFHWEYLAWPRNALNLVPNQVLSCKIEQSESIRHVIPQNIQNEHGKIQFKQKQTKQELIQKTSDQDTVITVQKKAISLARKKYITQQEKDQLKRYRKMRLQGYLAKKMKRTFEKKIVYTIRKRVADKRIRYKGKFINECQARQLLGVSGEEHSFEELKDMMKLLKTQF